MLTSTQQSRPPVYINKNAKSGDPYIGDTILWIAMNCINNNNNKSNNNSRISDVVLLFSPRHHRRRVTSSQNNNNNNNEDGVVHTLPLPDSRREHAVNQISKYILPSPEDATRKFLQKHHYDSKRPPRYYCITKTDLNYITLSVPI